MASKYHSGAPFCPRYSSLSPPTTEFTTAMSRSSSRDSTSSVFHYQFHAISAYTSNPMHSIQAPTSAPMRRSSSSSSSTSTWLPSPYRSCLNTSSEQEPSSYLSDDDLLCLNIPVESIPNPERQQGRNMTTEEQIQHLRQIQEEEQQQQQSRQSSSTHSKKTVRFEEVSRKPRRPSQLKRRTTAVRRGLSTLNGPS